MKSKTYYNLILDQSGSMSGARTETLNALNAQIESCRQIAITHPNQELLLSLTLFNTSVQCLFSNLSPNQTPLLTQKQYEPNGSTALLDAIGMQINKLEEVIQPNDDVVMVILTDGQENASQYYNFKQISERISQLKATERWTFSFMGADIDAWDIASRLQIDRDEVVSFDKREMSKQMHSVSNDISDFMKLKSEGFKKKGFFSK
jgi:uncharacterized protein YegL